MIVNDHGEYYEMIPQHEHARLSYEIVKKWGDPFLVNDPLCQPLFTAVRQHDRAWIPLDLSPIMNPITNQPCDFTDYPEEQKLNAYQRGIQETQDMHFYSGLLVSYHYSSFLKHNNSKRAKSFISTENERQQLLQNKISNRDRLNYHFRVLQFCDDLSLYACMNNPGADKHEEISWFKQGFRQQFSFVNNSSIYPRFTKKTEITLTPFPLSDVLKAQVAGRKVWKQEIEGAGLSAAFLKGEEITRQFTFIEGI